MATASKQGTKPAAEWTREDHREFLEGLKQEGNTEKITRLGEYFHLHMGIGVPGEPQTFTYYPKLNMHGEPDGAKLIPVKDVPDHLRQGTSYNVITAETDVDFRRMAQTSHYIAGEYTLVVNGVGITVARGEETVSRYDPASGKSMVDVVPQAQNFMGRFRNVDPRADLEHYLWLWMHPCNFDGPARLSNEEFQRFGFRVNMTQKYTRETYTVRIRANTRRRKEHQQASDNADSMQMCAEVNAMTEKEMRKLCILTDIPSSRMSNATPERLPTIYKDWLYSVINDSSGTLPALNNKTKLKAAMSRGEEHTNQVIGKAFDAGVLVLDGQEFWAVDKDGGTSQPLTLQNYIVPSAAIPVARDWLAGEIDRNRDAGLTNLIDTMTVERANSLFNGRGVDSDRAAAVDRAIAQGSVKAINNPKHWVLASTGEKICNWNGVSDDQKRKSLLNFASSYSIPALLLQLGLSEE